MKKFFLLFIVVAVSIGLVACNESTEDVLAKASFSTAAYLLCKKEPAAIEPMSVLCGVQSDEAATAIQLLYAQYEDRLADYPFAKMQVDMLLSALQEEIGVDLTDPAVDLSAVDGDTLKPFVDAACAGVLAARSEAGMAAGFGQGDHGTAAGAGPGAAAIQ